MLHVLYRILIGILATGVVCAILALVPLGLGVPVEFARTRALKGHFDFLVCWGAGVVVAVIGTMFYLIGSIFV